MTANQPPEAPRKPGTGAEQSEPRLRKQVFLRGRDLRASAIGWEIAIPIFLGPLTGFLIDRANQTGVRWTIILLIAGVTAAVISVVRYINYEMHLMNRELNEMKGKDKKTYEPPGN